MLSCQYVMQLSIFPPKTYSSSRAQEQCSVCRKPSGWLDREDLQWNLEENGVFLFLQCFKASRTPGISFLHQIGVSWISASDIISYKISCCWGTATAWRCSEQHGVGWEHTVCATLSWALWHLLPANFANKLSCSIPEYFSWCYRVSCTSKDNTAKV